MLARLHNEKVCLVRVKVHQFLVQIDTEVLIANNGHPLCLLRVALHRLNVLVCETWSCANTGSRGDRPMESEQIAGIGTGSSCRAKGAENHERAT